MQTCQARGGPPSSCARTQHAPAIRRTPARPVQRCQAAPDEASSSQSRTLAAASLASLVVMGGAVAPAQANQAIASFAASGLLFKDTVEVTALDDPEINGVTVYVSDFKRSIVDKLAKDFFSEPSQASISCAVTGPVSFRQPPEKLGGAEGQELFSESKGFNFFKNKTLRIRRVYDSSRNAVVYVAYSTRLSTAADDGGVSSGRYRTSLCTLALPTSPAAPDLN